MGLLSVVGTIARSAAIVLGYFEDGEFCCIDTNYPFSGCLHHEIRTLTDRLSRYPGIQ